MRNLVGGVVLALVVLAGVALPNTAAAGDRSNGCNGLDVAHAQLHDTPIPGEGVLHILRAHDGPNPHHCG